jgi:hypothetical protein
MQNKKALVIAVTVALAIPGYSLAAKGDDADSVIELYGKPYPEIVVPSGSGPTEAGSQVSTLSPAPSGEKGIIRKTEMESSNSRFGIRGHEKLSSDV